jgi:hypothetical protein
VRGTWKPIEGTMSHKGARMAREQKTVEAMIGIYCREQHRSNGVLCSECAVLASYVQKRLQNCPFQENKTTCARCPVHCYRPDMRARIKAVMRYAGPRMTYCHPILSLQHMIDGLRKPPPRRRAAPREPGPD